MFWKRFLFFILSIWALPFYVWMHAIYMPGAQETQKRVSNPLDLKLQVVVNSLVGAGKQVWVSLRATNTLNCQSISLDSPLKISICFYLFFGNLI